MQWTVGIDGPDAVLLQLAIAVSGEDIRIDTRRQGGTLRAVRLDAFDDAAGARREAERIVAVLSAFARLVLGSREPLNVREVAGPGDRPAAGRRDVPDAWLQSSLFQSLRLALADPAMEQALRLRNASSLDWPALMQIYAVIEEAAGGRPAVERLSGVSRSVLQQLRRAAEPQRQERALTLSEAGSVVDRLLMAWLGAAARHSPARPRPAM